MTELEAEALAARLTRIWTPEKELKWEFTASGQQPEEHFDCFTEWAPGIELEYSWWDRPNSFVLEASRKIPFPHEGHEHIIVGRLRCYKNSGRIESIFPVQLSVNKELRNLYDQFAAQYLYPFRRGCWLSGCPIGATAHEKAEWIQGFTIEEFESWNLKI